MGIRTSVEKLMQLQSRLSAYNHAMSMIYYDGATTAPKGTAANRAHTLGILSEESYKLSTGEETAALLEELDAHAGELTAEQRRMVELMLKDIRRLQRIPMEEYIAYQELLVEAEDVWHTAKEQSDFATFEPLLEKIFDANIRIAKYCAPEKDPYEYWLGEYEDGLTIEKCDAFFDRLRSAIVPLIAKVAACPQVDTACLKGDFPDMKQEELARYLMELMDIDPRHCGLGTTEHPFTTSIGSHHDVRITTNYRRHDYSSSLFSVVHEGGHALYDMHSADEYAYTVLDGGVSMGIHESQSRFYENIIGRSRAFVEYIYPKLCELFPDTLKGYTAEDLYRAFNIAQPSLIRTEADEVTYALHVMVRYELEKKVMHGELSVHDLPAEWNRLYKEYLGVDVPDDRQGVLQDSHWSGGMIGYFPSYALGSAYGAQIVEKMKQDVDIDKCLAEGDFAPINEWNREHIWKYGCLYKSGELLEKVLGGEFDPKYYTDYLAAKVRSVYGV